MKRPPLHKRAIRYLVRWYWIDACQEWQLRLTPFGRNRATVFPNGVWHTWDKNGIGGENSRRDTAKNAKREAYYSLMQQEWI